MIDNSKGRSWVEISLPILKSNLERYKSLLPDNTKIMAVVKADAYGHGDAIVAKHLYDNGVRYFAVSNIDEAIHIREAGVGGRILILGYTPISRASDLIKHDITQALISEQYAERIYCTHLPVKCEFAIDTGMRRVGLNADNLKDCERIIRHYSKLLNLDGMFTHLCVADSDNTNAVDFTNEQIFKFESLVKLISDLKLPFCHSLNSAGALWHHSAHSCFARLGIILYGLKPDYTNTLPDGIQPVLRWKSLVSMVKTVVPGDRIGYGRTFIVEHPMTVATIPTGYADGYSRQLSNKGFVLIKGERAPILGRVCMDQLMVDVTDIPGVEMETEVILLGESGNEKITADDMAQMIGTIGYEVVCGISKRVNRVYL